MADGIFAGLRVIDCASWIAGAAAATILSDVGARVALSSSLAIPVTVALRGSC
jgi:hypothetical protein